MTKPAFDESEIRRARDGKFATMLRGEPDGLELEVEQPGPVVVELFGYPTRRDSINAVIETCVESPASNPYHFADFATWAREAGPWDRGNIDEILVVAIDDLEDFNPAIRQILEREPRHPQRTLVSLNGKLFGVFDGETGWAYAAAGSERLRCAIAASNGNIGDSRVKADLEEILDIVDQETLVAYLNPPKPEPMKLKIGGPADGEFEFHAPADWHDRIRALGDRLEYGPGYRRDVSYQLREMSRNVADGYSALGYDHLLEAERLVAAKNCREFPRSSHCSS